MSEESLCFDVGRNSTSSCDEDLNSTMSYIYGTVVEESDPNVQKTMFAEFQQLIDALKSLNRNDSKLQHPDKQPAIPVLPDIFCKLFEEDFKVTDYLIMCLYGLIIVISLFGNFLVFSVIIRTRRLHTITNLFIANLALGDLLMTTFNIPFTVVRLMLDDWPFGGFMCSIVPFTQSVSVFVSSYTMTAIAIDRYQETMWNLGSIERYFKAAPQVISTPLHVRPEFRDGYWRLAVIWSLALLLSLPWALYHSVSPVTACRTLHRCQLMLPSYSRAVISLVMFLIQFLVPLLVTMLAYSHISHHLWGSQHIGAVTQQQQLRRLASRRRTIKMLILVVILFAVSWLPLNLYHLVSDWSRETSESLHSSTIFFISHILAMSNVTCNPFVYFWLNKHFRDSVENCCFWVRNLRLGSRTITGSTDFQQAQSKNSALVTDVDTTSGVVIPLQNMNGLNTK